MNRFMRLAAYLLILCLLATGLQVPGVAEQSNVETWQLEQEITNELVEKLGSEDFEIKVHTRLMSKESLEELAFKYRKTNWFGYYLDEVDQAMEGKKWVFTCENGETIVKEFEAYDDTYDIALRNVAIGTGVIIICVTVSAVSGGLGAPAISAIFAVSAKSAAVGGISSGVIVGTVSGAVTAA